MQGKLYIVGTPIGNLGDISVRALETLRNCDFIAAEDTRVARKLLTHFDIQKDLVSYYEHNRYERGAQIVARILAGESCALTTDAGMPVVSDPGGMLVAQCREAGIVMEVVPGPCALIAAFALAGLESTRFTFEGFLSTNKRSRREHLDTLRQEMRPMIFYEAPHKLCATLDDFAAVFGADRGILLARELTKVHEESQRTTVGEAIARFTANPPRGEFVLVLDGAKPNLDDEGEPLANAITAAHTAIANGASVRDAVRSAAEQYGISRNQLYDEIKDTLQGVKEA